MTLRTKNRAQQWLVWLGAALVATAAYVVLARVLCDSASLDILDPRHYRFALPLVIAFVVFAWETRWDGVVREKENVGGGGESRSRELEEVKGEGQGQEAGKLKCKVEVEERNVSSSTSQTPQTPQTFQTPLPGEAEYVQARGMTHQPIPDVKHDGEYLKLLAKSAELGYPKALAKLGDYAMRRGCNVEAYYWLWRAKRAGMGNLDRTLLQVRSAWASGGFRRESMNEYEGFTHEQGTIGYALLCIDARHNADAAKARLANSSYFRSDGGWSPSSIRTPMRGLVHLDA